MHFLWCLVIYGLQLKYQRNTESSLYILKRSQNFGEFSEYLNFKTTNAQFFTTNLKILCKHVRHNLHDNQKYAIY